MRENVKLIPKEKSTQPETYARERVLAVERINTLSVIIYKRVFPFASQRVDTTYGKH